MIIMFKERYSRPRRVSEANKRGRCSGQGHRPIFILTLLAAALYATSPSVHAYVEQGKIGDKASWESAEYDKYWGLKALKASSAYALGYNGQGVKVGVMDSGALLQTHSELSGERFHAVRATGEYGSSGNRYPQSPHGLPYTEGEAFDITGQWVKGLNDSHGTHVAGTVGANRDGNGMHGVAWGADVYVGNNGGSDNNNYGPYQDYQFFYAGWKAMVDAGAQVINNSWGTNTRIVNNSSIGADGGNTGVHLPANTLAQTEYEYFYFNKQYGDKPSFVDAAYDAVKGTGVVQIFTTGNRDFAHPFYRPLYPYFNPEAEKQWVAVAGLKQDGSGGYTLEKVFNEAGNAKWWTVVAPARDVYSATTDDDGNPGYASWGGTSMAAPHVAGAMGVLLSRYQDMNGMQVRDVMFTTASNQNADGNRLADWGSADGVPDVRYGWGVPDLEKGMYGPGQFLGRFDYNMATTPLDVWSNDVSQVALNARKAEEQQWLSDYQAWLGDGLQHGDVGGAFELGNSFVVNDGNSDPTDHIINQADAEKWRKAYYEARAGMIQHKLDNGLYDGALVKRGAGQLVMTGDNTYAGGTTVEGGTLYGFTESFGTGNVTVNGGRFGVISSYDDTFTRKGQLTSNQNRLVNVEVNKGGTYVIVVNDHVSVDKLTFNQGAAVTVDAVDKAMLDEVYKKGVTVTGTVKAETLTDNGKVVTSPDYAFFKADVQVQPTFAPTKTLVGTLSKIDGVSFSSYALNHNARAIAGTLDLMGGGALYHALLPSTKGQLLATYDSLGSDFYLNANNASIVNALSTSRTIKEQAMGIGTGQRAQLEGDSARIWMTGIGDWASVDYGHSDMDVDYYAALVGAEVDVTENNTLGLFFGAGSSKYKGGTYGSIDSNDLHLGLYGKYNAGDVAALTYGFMHTNQDRDASRTLTVANQIGINSVSADAKITQLFAEAAYTGLNSDKYRVEPYLGVNWMRVKTDRFSEFANNMLFSTDTQTQTVKAATVGVRAGVPFKLGGLDMAAKGGVSAMHFFGNSRPEAYMSLADTGVARLRGGKLDNMFGVSLGVEANVTKASKVELSYTGAFNGDIKSNGVYLKGRINF